MAAFLLPFLMHLVLLFLFFGAQTGPRRHAGCHGNCICPSFGFPKRVLWWWEGGREEWVGGVEVAEEKKGKEVLKVIAKAEQACLNDSRDLCISIIYFHSFSNFEPNLNDLIY